MADEVVSHAFSHSFRPQHIERLATYWGEALGGPNAYSARYGDETAVVRTNRVTTAGRTRPPLGSTFGAAAAAYAEHRPDYATAWPRRDQ
jgi:truncated hemoglobin YjbI